MNRPPPFRFRFAKMADDGKAKGDPKAEPKLSTAELLAKVACLYRGYALFRPFHLRDHKVELRVSQ